MANGEIAITTITEELFREGTGEAEVPPLGGIPMYLLYSAVNKDDLYMEYIKEGDEEGRIHLGGSWMDIEEYNDLDSAREYVVVEREVM